MSKLPISASYSRNKRLFWLYTIEKIDCESYIVSNKRCSAQNSTLVTVYRKKNACYLGVRYCDSCIGSTSRVYLYRESNPCCSLKDSQCDCGSILRDASDTL